MTQALTIEQMLALANEAAEVSSIDMTEATAGGGSKPMPIGNALARLVTVVELGEHMQLDFQTKKPKGLLPEVKLAFALWGQGVAEDGKTPMNFHNDDGTPRIFNPFDMALSRNSGSTAFRLFKALNWKNTATNFAQLLNCTVIMPFTLQDKSKQDKTQVVKLNIDGIIPPLDPITRAPYPVPELPVSEFTMFLWERPIKEAWDALYVEGEWPAKDGKPAQSKNKVQEKILKAANFAGSPLELLLGGGATLALPSTPAAVVAPVAPVAAPVAAVAAPAVAQVAAPLVVPAVAAVPAAAPAGVQVPATPAAPVVAVPSSPVLPA